MIPLALSFLKEKIHSSFLTRVTMYSSFLFARLSVRYDYEEKGEKEKETKWVLKRHVSFVYTDLLSSFNIAPRSYLRSKHFPFYSLSNSFRSSTGIAIRCKSTIVSDRRSKNSTREKKKKKKGKKRKEKKENFVPRSGELRGWCIDIRTLKVWWPRGSFFFFFFFFFLYIWKREEKKQNPLSIAWKIMRDRLNSLCSRDLRVRNRNKNVRLARR